MISQLFSLVLVTLGLVSQQQQQQQQQQQVSLNLDSSVSPDPTCSWRCPIVNGYEEDHHVADCTDEYWAEDESSSGCGSNGVTLCRYQFLNDSSRPEGQCGYSTASGTLVKEKSDHRDCPLFATGPICNTDDGTYLDVSCSTTSAACFQDPGLVWQQQQQQQETVGAAAENPSAGEDWNWESIEAEMMQVIGELEFGDGGGGEEGKGRRRRRLDRRA